MKNSQELIDLLMLKKIDNHIFSGNSVSIGNPKVFGGQVAAQALHAAYQTVAESRFVNSLHSYFLEPGNLTIPIRFEVTEMRNGGSFSTRRVTATQNNKTLFILAASFHKREKGFEHQKAMEMGIKQPEELLSWDELYDRFGAVMSKSMKKFLSIERPIEFKPVHVANPLDLKNLPAKETVWFRLKGEQPTMTMPMRHQILTYISDYNVLNAAFNPNAKKYSFGNTQTASLDHSMWFFRCFDFNDWMLFTTESPSAFGARGLSHGNIFTRDGKLVATVAQEGLMRPKEI